MTETKETKKRIYCAVYCRKSVEERAEETFGSIENQHESILSFIASHKHEGWVALAERYDDNGFTGSNTNRPSLQKLINDIKESRVNMVIVYKLDRLSRSLVDFVQLLKLKHQMSLLLNQKLKQLRLLFYLNHKQALQQ